ncbi:MAG: glycosyltransferase family protein [Thermacetogeniaceae bacterium]
MKTVIIVQARMTSTRLPKKILLPVLNKPLLEYQVERLRRVRLCDDLVIATTENKTDDPVVELCRMLQVPYFRGPEEDVLARYFGAALEFEADTVVRITSDCPLIDPEIIDKVIDAFNGHGDRFDYVSNSLKRTYPRGMDTEVLPFNVLKEAYVEAVAAEEREHVTPFIYLRPGRYRLGSVVNDVDHANYRLTVDTREDFELIKLLIEKLYPSNPLFNLQDILGLLLANPEWAAINSHIEQKKLQIEARREDHG